MIRIATYICASTDRQEHQQESIDEWTGFDLDTAEFLLSVVEAFCRNSTHPRRTVRGDLLGFLSRNPSVGVLGVRLDVSVFNYPSEYATKTSCPESSVTPSVSPQISG